MRRLRLDERQVDTPAGEAPVIEHTLPYVPAVRTKDNIDRQEKGGTILHETFKNLLLRQRRWKKATAGVLGGVLFVGVFAAGFSTEAQTWAKNTVARVFGLPQVNEAYQGADPDGNKGGPGF
ncbi:MAG: hypothetical protein AB1500_02905 [Bacillota bacterium]